MGAVSAATWLGCFAEEIIIDLSPQMPRLRLYATRKFPCVLYVLRGKASHDLFMSTPEQIDKEFRSNDSSENTAFNGAELSESVFGRDWNSTEEDGAWSNL